MERISHSIHRCKLSKTVFFRKAASNHLIFLQPPPFFYLFRQILQYCEKALEIRTFKMYNYEVRDYMIKKGYMNEKNSR